MLIFLFAIAVVNTGFLGTNAVSNCSLCMVQGDFSETDGYACFPLSNGRVACTCPDQRYTIDKPCRICERENICGDSSDNFCAEVSAISSDADGESTHYFSCFCSDHTYYIGKACPPKATTPVSTTATTTSVPATTATTASTPSVPTTATPIAPTTTTIITAKP
ncbi:unnamed protein product [Adineta steineri]|uniref:Uncharacterized protein n=1 Tax=Adineta steineri TaxID=433720 RepID=A0A814UXF4_9BILA|nr:unnamed protein product [Adineta steineri]CAF1177894.1 unnamed protein product [Adineta steineri]CAF3541020.1 unnamed protein product [Adineta steineri]